MTVAARRAVLGIDAAWTETEPSGVALAVEREGGWRLAAVGASYDHFLARATGVAPGEARPRGSEPDAAALIDAVHRMCGRTPDVVAVDMPLARHPIVGRRCCDDEVTRAYGAKGAAVLSPSAARPGALSDRLREAFEALDDGLCVKPPARGLIEVYPHAALIEFLRAPRRLEYKAGKIGRDWPSLSDSERQDKLRAVWARIVETVARRIAGVAEALPLPAPDLRGWRLKAYEDKLDAIVCCAVGVAALDGEAKAYGQEDAAIWVPVGESAMP